MIPFSAAGPYIHLGTPGAALPADPSRTLRLPGGEMRQADALFDVFARVLRLPDYFGANWDALDECLTDLDLLPGHDLVLVLEDAGLILSEAEDERACLAEILARSAEAWAEASLPEAPLSLHVVLLDTPEALLPWRAAFAAQDATVTDLPQG